MALQVATPGAAEYVGGPVGVGGLYTEQRTYDKSDLVVLRNRYWAMLDSFLRTQLKKTTVKSVKPTYFNRQQAPIKMTIGSNATSSAGSLYDYLHIPDGQAAQLGVGEVLVVPDIFCDYAGDNYTTSKSTAMSNGYRPETLLITAIGVAGSGAGSGNTRVDVTRGNANAPTTPTQILTTHVLLRGSLAMLDGANPITPWSHENNSDFNYLQLISKTVGQTETSEHEDMYGKMTRGEMRQEKTEQLFRETETQLLFGRRGIATGNKPRWYMGGLFEYIPIASAAMDGVSRLYDFAGPFEVDRWLQFMDVATNNGRDFKMQFCGRGYDRAIQVHFDKYVRINDTLSRTFGWPVKELVYGGRRINWAVHPIFQEMTTSLTNYDNDAITLDPKYIGLMVLQGMDLRLKIDVPQVSTSHQQVDEIYYQTAPLRQHADAHSYLYGLL